MRFRGLTSATLALMVIVPWAGARAADPGSGTISPGGPSLSYRGANLLGASVVHPLTCIEGVSCDTFTLTVDVPAGSYDKEPFDLTLTITWEDDSDDLDLWICPDPNCLDAESSASGSGNSETVVLHEPESGVLRVIATGYGGASDYTGTISFAPPQKPASPSLAVGPADLRAETTGGGKLVAQIPFPSGTDLDFRGSLAYVGSYDEEDGGLRIIDIADPRRPRLIGRLACAGYQNDVGVWRTTVVMGMHDSGNTPGCNPVNEGGLRIIDVADPTEPRQVSFLPIEGGGTHTLTIVGDTGYVYANPGGLTVCPGPCPEDDTSIVDIRDPARPRIVGRFAPPNSTGCHDINVAGNRAYCAGSNVTHIMDITDPVAPKVISSIYNPLIFFHHGAVPSSDGKVLVIADEAFAAHACDPLGANPTGAFWFYDISNEELPIPRGWISQTGRTSVESIATQWCTAHNFNMVPDRPWMVSSAYLGGTSIIDFSDPADPTIIARVTPQGAITWSSYFHRGFIFTGDLVRGFDVIELPELTKLAPASAGSPSPKPSPAVGGKKTVRPKGGSLPATGVPSSALALAGAAAIGAAAVTRKWIGGL